MEKNIFQDQDNKTEANDESTLDTSDSFFFNICIFSRLANKFSCKNMYLTPLQV